MNKILITVVALLLFGCSHYVTQQENQTYHYQCGTTPLTIDFNGVAKTASLVMDGEQLKLKQIPSVSGEKYSNGKYSLRTTGQHAILERNDKTIMNDCVLAK
ncbi:MliC family protein [Serratia sp. UGAL515B_01]|uniref:MliC family protein n=1 Tax=Serratia sp. UGAL515B_01 TaxID=2986763 RepID=UPI002954576C|nr:MliC family protein [Serratia sp. UGAL515B_01]WON78734.1 MliC family protein [Serratia sp. UGAL515B_01]